MVVGSKLLHLVNVRKSSLLWPDQSLQTCQQGKLRYSFAPVNTYVLGCDVTSHCFEIIQYTSAPSSNLHFSKTGNHRKSLSVTQDRD